MKIALVFPYYNDRVYQPTDVLAAYPIVHCLPPAIAALGHDVRVFLQAARDGVISVDGVNYEFIAAAKLVKLAARTAYRWRGNLGAAYYEPIFGLVHAIEKFQPDTIHFFGLTMDLQLAQIVRLCRQRTIPLVVHFHGGEPALGHRRQLQRRNLAHVDRTLFTTREQAASWIMSGSLPDWSKVASVVETSSPFQRIARTEARQQTEMIGDPVCLSVGRLHPIKDPITMLRGFARFTESAPGARLYLYYLTAELLDDVHEFIASVPGLANGIELRGRANPIDMPVIYSSADLLLQASTREWSGLAILEALSCGCVPVVSDIPSFRKLTNGGRHGWLFPVGDADGLAIAISAAWSADTASLSDEIEAYFRASLSFDAMARQLSEIYRELRHGFSSN